MNSVRCVVLIIALFVLLSEGASAAKPLHTRTIDLIPGQDLNTFVSAFNPTTNKVYSTGAGGHVTVADATTRLVIGTFRAGEGALNALIVNPATNRIYGVGSDDQLIIIDGGTDQPLAPITLPSSGHFGLAIDLGLNRLYVSNYFDASVTIVDLLTNQVVGSLAVGGSPWGLAVNPQTHAIYVASNGTPPATPGKLSVIDPTSNPAILLAEVPADGAREVVFNPTANKVYVTLFANTTGVRVIDAANNSVLTTLGIDRPVTLAVNPTVGVNRVYTSSPAGSSLITIDGVTSEVDAEPGNISEQRIKNISVNVATGEVAAIHDASATIFDSANQRVGSIAFAAEPKGVAVNPVTGKMYVLNGASNSVLVVNASTGSLIKDIPLSGAPGSIVINPNTNRIYVTTPIPGNITSIDGSDDHVIYSRGVLVLTERTLNPDGSITERHESFRPNRMALDLTNNRIFVLQEGFVSEVDGAKEAADPGFEPNPHWPVATGGIDQVGFDSADIAYNAQTNRLYVAAKTIANSGQLNQRAVASIIVKAPQQGAPLSTIVDPGQYDTLPYSGVVLNSSTGILFAAGQSSATGVRAVKVIDTNPGSATHNSVSATIPLAPIYTGAIGGPLALNPNLNRLYVFDAPPYPDSFGAHLRTIDGTSRTLDSSFDQKVLQYKGVAFDSQTKSVFVTARDSVNSGQSNMGGIVHVFFDGPDATPPVGFVASPQSGQSYSASVLAMGTVHVTDGRSDVASVKVSLRNDQGQYWDGAQWVTGSEVFFDATAPESGSGDWTFALPTRAQGFGRGAYTMRARMTDSAGNTSDTVSEFNIITPGAFSFTSATLSADENVGSLPVIVNRIGGSDGAVDVIYNVTDGTARNFESSQGATIIGDYVQPSQQPGDVGLRTLHFASGQTAATFSVPITADNFIEGPQTVNLSLASPSTGSELGAVPRAVLTIVDNEPPSRLAHIATVDLIRGSDVYRPVSLAVNPVTNKVYVAGNHPLGGTGSVAVIDGASGAVVDGQRISTINGPDSIAVDTSLNRVYVLQVFSTTSDFRASIQAFDGTTGQPMTERTPLPGTFAPRAIAADSVRHRVYVADGQAGLTIVDGQTSAVIGSIPISGLTAPSLAVNETSNKIYLSSTGGGSGRIFIIDGETQTMTQVEGSHRVLDMAVNNASDTTYVLASEDNVSSEILVIKGTDDSITSFPLGFSASCLAVDGASGLLYVASGNPFDASQPKKIHVLNAANGAEFSPPIETSAHRIAFLPGVSRLFYTGGTKPNSIGIAHLATDTLSTIITGAVPGAVATLHTDESDKTYVADQEVAVIYVIEGDTVARQIPLPAIAKTLAAVDSTNRVYFSSLTEPSGGEDFTDQNNSFAYDLGEPFTDANGNGVYDPLGSQGIVIRSIDAISDGLDPAFSITLGSPDNRAGDALPMTADSEGMRLYVVAGFGTSLHAIDANPASASFKGVQTRSIPGGTNLALNPEAGRLYLTEETGDSRNTTNLLVLDADTLATLDTAPVVQDEIFGSSPFGLAVDSSNGRIYLSSIFSGGKEVFVINGTPGSGTEHQVLDRISVGHIYNHYSTGLGALVVDSTSHRVFVSDPQGDTAIVGVIDGSSFTDTLAEASGGPAMAFNAATQLLFAPNTGNGTIQVLGNADTGQLPAPTDLTFDTSVPFTAGMQWTFSVTAASNVPGLVVRFQSRLENDTVWSNLPGTVTRVGSQWTLVTNGVPSGDIVVRAVASAPGFTEGISSESAPVEVLVGSGLLIPRLTKVGLPPKAGKPWTFFVTADKRTPSLRVQFSANGTSFQDLPDVRVLHTRTKWTLKASNVPADAAFFRVNSLSATGEITATSNIRSIFKVDASIAGIQKESPKVTTSTAVGRKIFTIDGSKQTKKFTVNRGGTASFAISFKNNSRLQDTICISGPAGDANFSVQYFQQGGTVALPVVGQDITASVVNGTYVRDAQPGVSSVIYVKITASLSVVSGSRGDFVIVASSQRDPLTVDAVKGQVKIR